MWNQIISLSRTNGECDEDAPDACLLQLARRFDFPRRSGESWTAACKWASIYARPAIILHSWVDKVACWGDLGRKKRYGL